mgnify:CR=1 FL=1
MKAFMFMVILLFAFMACLAPELTAKNKADQKARAIIEINRMAYEANRKIEFERFRDDLRFSESPDWKKINSIGCMGWFQFQQATLDYLGYGYITPERFSKFPEIFPKELQVELFTDLIGCNEIALKDYMIYIGSTINGVTITKSGLLAGSHLGGANGVILFLESNGTENNRDINRTSIADYLRKFQGYGI